MAPEGFMFGPWQCKWEEAFFISPLSLGIVNLKPIVPGHCLVLSKRVVPRFANLSPEEVSDLWTTVHAISPVLQRYFNAEGLQLAIQDGPVAGQTVPHVHCHIVPRRPGDFKKNDDVYDALDNSDMTRKGVDAEDRSPRTKAEMAEEAMALRQLFVGLSLPIPSASD